MTSAFSMLEIIAGLQTPALEVHAERCVLVRDRNANCLKCADVCAGGCISYEGEELSIDVESCIGCGTCASACPTSAIEAKNPSDEVLFDKCLSAMKTAGEGRVTVVCARVLEAAGARINPRALAGVECLGRAEESLIFALFASGATDIVFVHGDCSKCEHESGFKWACNVVKTVEELSEVWPVQGKVHIESKLPSYTRAEDAGYDISKRCALEDAGSAAVSYGANIAASTLKVDVQAENNKVLETFPKVGDDGTLPHFIPRKRRTLLGALSQIGEAADEMIACRLWGHVIIDTDKCTSCRMCAVFCPTAALQKVDEGELFGVAHVPGMCVKCRTCETICPAGALEISDEVFAREMLAGKTDTYIMKKPEVERGNAHTVWNLAKGMFNIEEVYER